MSKGVRFRTTIANLTERSETAPHSGEGIEEELARSAHKPKGSSCSARGAVTKWLRANDATVSPVGCQRS